MPMETRQLRSAPIAATGKFKIPPAIRTFPLQSGEMKCDPEMDKLAIWDRVRQYEFMPAIFSYSHFSFTLHFKLFSFWFMGRQRTMTLTDSADAMMNMVLNELCLKWK